MAGRFNRDQYRSVALLVLAGLWLALAAALLGQFAWPLELFTHFRVQYAAGFILLAFSLMLLRRPLWAGCALLGALLGALPLLPYLAPGASARALAAQPPTLRLMSFNTWGDNTAPAALVRFIEQAGADVVVLQEFPLQSIEVLQAKLPAYPYSFIAHGRQATVLLSRWPVLAANNVSLLAQEGGVSQVSIDWQGVAVQVLGVHLNWPLGARESGYRNQQLQALAALARAQTGAALVAGDFNTTPWSPHFRDLLAQADFMDAGRGFGVRRSWPARFAPAGIRIDHCLHSRHWRVLDAHTGPALGSDHLPLIVDLQLIDAPMDRGRAAAQPP